MTRLCHLIMAALLSFATSASAQSWSSRTNDTGGLIYGVTQVRGNSMNFNCNAISPSRRPLIETGDHETNRTAALTMSLSISQQLVDPFNIAPELNPLRMSIDGQDYTLPPARWDEFFGEWFVHLSLESPFWAALTQAQSLIVDPGRGTAFDYPVDGLGASLAATISYCLQGWQSSGTPIPVSLRPWIQASAPSAQAPAQSHLGSVTNYINRLCQASYTFDPAQLLSGDLDGDGTADYVLDWNTVTCHGNFGPRPYCGAANCQIDVFLSSRGYVQNEGDGFLGVGVRVVPLNTGRAGLLIGGTAAVCATGACARPWFWNGTNFTQ